MNTKEEITAAAAKRFKTKDVDLGGGVTVTLRELSAAAHGALRKRMFQTEADGTLKVDGDSYLTREGVHFTEEWLAATMTPEFTVDELLAAGWPESLKLELRREAMALNGLTLKDAAGNS